jgi:ribosome-associated heat shock protein Hsp15
MSNGGDNTGTIIKFNQMSIDMKKSGFSFQFKVVELLKNRVAAPIAITCYENMTPPEELNKYNEWFVGKGGIEFRDRGTGRPTKKERREIDGFKDDWFDVDFDEDDL